jgi:hypothetical protein
MSGKSPFKRIVLGMHHGAPDDDTLRAVAELAELMHMPLLGLYAEDPGLLDLAGLPFAREFRPLGGGWHPLDVERLSQEVQLAAERLQHRFDRTVKDVSIESSFRVVKSSTSNMIAALSEAGDIVVVTEPADPADRATHQAAVFVDAAFRSDAAVLLLPHHIARRGGPIVAIATEADDPAVRAAAGVAAAIGEKLVLVESDQAAWRQSALSDPGVADLEAERLAPKLVRLTDSSGICSALSHVAERLVVMTRGAFDDAVPAMVASIRHIPVLVVQPSGYRSQNGEVPAN